MKKAIIIDSTLAQYTAEDISWLQKFFLEQGVLGNSSGALGLAVSQRGAGANLSVDVAVGNALIDFTKNSTNWKIIGLSNAIENVAVSSQSSGANRVGALIMRASVTTEPNVLKNNIITFEFIPGTSTSPLSDGAILTAISNDAFIRLANITVPTGASSIVTGNIADTRVQCKTNESIKLAPQTLNFSVLASDPASPVEGQVWYNSTTHTLNFYNNSSVKQLGSTQGLFNPFVVSAQSTPNMTLAVASGEAMIGATPVHYAGGNSPTFVVPATGGHKRIDLLVIDKTGTLSIIQGTSHATTPVTPSYPLGYLVLAEVYLRNGGTSIKTNDDSTNCYIYRDPRGLYVADESTGRIGSYTAGEALSVGDAFFISSGSPIRRAGFYQPVSTQAYNAGYDIGYSGDTKKGGQTFVAKTSSIKSLNIMLNNWGTSGSITANVVIEIFATSGGAPTGSAIWSETIPGFTMSGYEQRYVSYTIATPPTLTPGTTYCISFEGNSSNQLSVSYNSAGGVSGFDAYTYNGSSWTLQTGTDLTLEMYDEITSPTAGSAYISEGYTHGEHNVVTGFSLEAVASGASFKGIVNGIVPGMSFGSAVSTVSETIDQQCTGGSEVTQQLYTGSNVVRQLFRTGDIANITKLGFKAQKINGGGGAVTVNIYDVPTGKIIGTGTIADGVITTTAQVYDCTFSTPITVKPNYVYMFELIASAGNSGTNYYNITARQTSSNYNYGFAFWSGTWNTSLDFHFQTKYTKAVAWSLEDPLYLQFGSIGFSTPGLGIKVGNVLSSSQFKFDTSRQDTYQYLLSSSSFGNQVSYSETMKFAVPKNIRKVIGTQSGVSSSTAEVVAERYGKTSGSAVIPTNLLNGSFSFNASDSSVQFNYGSGTTSWTMYFYK